MQEIDPLIHAYSHLAQMPRAAEALQSLQKIASIVKPLMRKRNWHVGTLTEFWPDQQNLLGLNVGAGQRICLRLRYPGDKTQFMPFENIVDTMLHELSHIVWGPHDHNFQHLWDELRDEHEALLRKGYTGEGFLSKGHRLGGKYYPLDEMRRQARAAAQKRRVLTKGSGQRLGGAPVQRGTDMRRVIADAVTRRNIINTGCGSGQASSVQIADQASRNGFRTKAEEDDANNRAINQALMELLEEEEERKLAGVFRAPSNEGLSWDRQNGLSLPGSDDESELLPIGSRKRPAPTSIGPSSVDNSPRASHRGSSHRLTASHAATSRPVRSAAANLKDEPAQHHGRPLPRAVAERESKGRSKATSTPTAPSTSTTLTQSMQSPYTWTCAICTLENPESYLCCDACGVERTQLDTHPVDDTPATVARTTGLRRESRPVPEASTTPLGWNCRRCGTFMERKWWTCSACGLMKASS